LIAGPHITVNPRQVSRLDVSEDGTVEIAFSNVSYHLPVKISPSVPEGLALVPKGLDGLQWDGLPFWFELKR
jgi:NADH-quinone oxidoreductase subunit G